MTDSLARTTTSPKVQENRRRRREEILRAALSAFRDKGYQATTLNDIAERLGVRKSALYHYFPDKDAILYACHRQSLEELSRHLAQARHRYRAAGDRLRYIVQEHVRIMTDRVEGSPLAFEVPALSPPLQSQVVHARDNYERGLREIIAEGMERGEIRDVDPKIAVFVILGALNWIARWYQPRGKVDPADLSRQFADQLLGGLVCPPQP